jgi:hypothetical protein
VKSSGAPETFSSFALIVAVRLETRQYGYPLAAARAMPEMSGFVMRAHPARNVDRRNFNPL